MAGPEHNEERSRDSAEDERIDSRGKWRAIDDDHVVTTAQIGQQSLYPGRAQDFGRALGPGATTDHGQSRVRGLLHECLLTDFAEEEVDQAGLAVGPEASMQHAAPNVAIDEQSVVATIREYEREVGRQERLP